MRTLIKNYYVRSTVSRSFFNKSNIHRHLRAPKSGTILSKRIIIIRNSQTAKLWVLLHKNYKKDRFRKKWNRDLKLRVHFELTRKFGWERHLHFVQEGTHTIIETTYHLKNNKMASALWVVWYLAYEKAADSSPNHKSILASLRKQDENLET